MRAHEGLRRETQWQTAVSSQLSQEFSGASADMYAVRALLGRVAALSLIIASYSSAQTAAASVVSVQIPEEADVEPSSFTLSFRIPPDGKSFIVSQETPIRARIRTHPGSMIHLRVRLRPDSEVVNLIQLASVAWKAETRNSAFPNQDARCSDGKLSDEWRDLALNWTRSGELSCKLTFQLNAPRTLNPGIYSVVVELGLFAM